MKERPINFSTPMVRALATKTQTRRIVKPQPTKLAGPNFDGLWSDTIDPVVRYFACPYGQPGDQLWVRETWYCDHFEVQHGPYLEVPGARELLDYAADGLAPYEAEQPVWRPSIHMPRWASRIQLEITGVRVERLNDISKVDAIAEGIEQVECGDFRAWKNYRFETAHPRKGVTIDPLLHQVVGFESPVASYTSLWESINGAGSWAANPWVWVVEFIKISA